MFGPYYNIMPILDHTKIFGQRHLKSCQRIKYFHFSKNYFGMMSCFSFFISHGLFYEIHNGIFLNKK